MQNQAKKTEEEKKSWEKPYKDNTTQENKGQYNLFRLYKKMGVLRSLEQLQQYCEENKTELQENNVSFPRKPCNILPMETQIPLGRQNQ
jgi:hypothetical protein